MDLSGRSAAFGAVVSELEHVVDDFTKLGFRVPREFAVQDLFCVAGQPFAPNELPPVQVLKDLPQNWQGYYGEVVQPEIRQRIEDQDPEVLELGMQVGRVIAASGTTGPLMRHTLPLTIDKNGVTVDNKRIDRPVPHGGIIIDYGMGTNGLYSHLENVKEGQYKVYAIQRGIGEVALLNGILDYNGVPEDVVTVESGGIADRVHFLLDNGAAGMGSMVIASRVHMAGEDLREGIRVAADLLHEDGLLVARGPRNPHFEDLDLMGYDEVYDMVAEDEALKLEPQSYTFASIDSYDEREPNRLVVARRL